MNLTALGWLAGSYITAAAVAWPFVRPPRHRRTPIRIDPPAAPPRDSRDRYTLAA